MAEPLASAAAPAEGADERTRPPRADLKDAVGWTVLGAATLAGSLAMDRLEKQDVNPYTVPGLLPGLLGLAMILLGLVLGARSVGRGALRLAPPVRPGRREERLRVAVVIALCVGYSVVLVGHGIPFWIASSLYVTTSILVVRRLSRDPAERQLGPRAWLQAVVIGVAAAAITHLVFQELFLVRLP